LGLDVLSTTELIDIIISPLVSEKLSDVERKRYLVKYISKNFPLGAYSEVTDFIKKHLQENSSLPSFQWVVDHCKHFDKYLNKLRVRDPISLSEYSNALERYGEIVRFSHLDRVLVESKRLLQTEGTDSAMNYVMSNMDVRERTITTAGEFDIKKYIEDMRENVTAPIMYMSAFDTHVSIPRGKVMTIFAYVSHLKTTMALNVAYNCAVFLKCNVAFLSLEMDKEELYKRFCILHGIHPKFKNDPNRVVFDWDSMKQNDLNEAQLNYIDYLRKDLNSPEYGKLFVLDSNDFENITISELENTLLYLDMLCGEVGLHIWFLDYIQLLGDISDRRAGEDKYQYISKVVRWAQQRIAKKFAGKGLSTVLLAQANRKGFANAAANQGRYALTDISDSSELERASDYVVSLFYGKEERQNGVVTTQLLKNKDGRTHQDPVKVAVDIPNWYMGDVKEAELSQDEADLLMARNSGF